MPVEADLNQLVSEALNRLEAMPHVELMRELQPLPAMLADREQIQSVVTNLTLNARDALGLEGRIGVRTEHVGGNVVLTVTDNGCGIDPEIGQMREPTGAKPGRGILAGVGRPAAFRHPDLRACTLHRCHASYSNRTS
jgi:C4-dicarboxylate-specific signal transduction histidine kinase